jgi:hypothetical protein
MKKILAVIFGISIFIGGIYFYTNNQETDQSQEQMVLEKTVTISKEYVALRYRTDHVLIDARTFVDYQTWNNEMEDIIRGWEKLEKDALSLEKSATEMTGEKVSFLLIKPALAYNKQEISDIFDKAPAGKKIATLAKHLGVDANRAFKILQQDQAQLEADGWNEAGDTFQKLETSATVIKDGCKIAGFVGGVIVSGGTSALAAGSTLAKAAVIVSGADLTLEVTDDAAKIALGNHNRVSALVNDVRKVTEPIASILAISDIPNNVSKNMDRFNAGMIVLDQFRGAAQEGKIIGIELPAYTKDKPSKTATVTVIQKEELEKWLSDNNIKSDLESKDEIEKILQIINKQSQETNLNTEMIPEVKVDELGKNTTIEPKIKEESKATEIGDSSGILSIISPEGDSFIPKSGLSFAVFVSDPESLMTEGRNVAVWCHWNFFLNNKPYVEKINPSIVHRDTQNVCEYSTLLVKDKGLLRVEFRLEKGTKSKYAEERDLQMISSVQRMYTVK